MKALALFIGFSLSFTSFALDPKILCEQAQQTAPVDHRACAAALCGTAISFPQTPEDVAELWKKFGITPSSATTRSLTNVQATQNNIQKVMSQTAPATVVAGLINDPATLLGPFLDKLGYVVAGFQNDNTPLSEFIFNNQLEITEASKTNAVVLQNLYQDLSILTNYRQYSKMRGTNLDSSVSFYHNFQANPQATFGDLLFKTIDRWIVEYENDLKTVARLKEIRNELSTNTDKVTFRQYQKEFQPFFDSILKRTLEAHRPLLETYAGHVQQVLNLLSPVTETINTQCELAHLYNQQTDKLLKSKLLDQWVNKSVEETNTHFLGKLSSGSAKHLGAELKKLKVDVIKYEINPKTNQIIKDSAGPYGAADKAFREAIACRLDKPIFDYFDGARIGLSPLIFTGMQRDVLSHELGHWLSHRIQNSKSTSSHSMLKFMALRNCLKSMHTEINPQPADRYAEEDFADWFTATTFTGDPRLGCFLGDFVGRDKESYDSHRKDTHSNTLFRQLHITQVKQQAVPSECQELINAKDEAPKRCEL